MHILKVKQLVDLFFENKVMKTFIKAAPVLKELAILGKITSGVRRWGPPLTYDHIVVDAYATGHFMALLRAPIGMSQIFESGPMGEQSRSIVEVLRHPQLCTYHAVTILEELPVSEVIELCSDLKKLLNQEAQVVCNKVYTSAVSLLELEALSTKADEFTQFLYSLLLRQNTHLSSLSALNFKLKNTEQILGKSGRDVIDTLVQGDRL